jgi:PD-(D/E)XK nuclease superfamily protein
MLFAWGYGQGGSNPERAKSFPPGPPLVRGSIGHAGLAHVYARQLATQDGTDPDRYYRPLEAMTLVAGTFGDLGEAVLPVAARAVRSYCEHYSTERWRIVGVESAEETSFLGYRYTARVDLKYMDRSGKVWYMDHKFVGKIESKVLRRYILSGQFLGLIHLGSRLHGSDFGGVQLNLVGCNVPGFLRVVPEPAPWMLERFPGVVLRAEQGIQDLERMMGPGGVENPSEPLPAAPSEHTCWTSYGPCPAFELCRWGSGSILEMVVEE